MNPPYTLQQTLDAINTLNKPDQPFAYRIEGNQIIGEWKYLDATWVGVFAAGNVDKEFRFTATLDESTHTLTTKDHQSQSQSSISFGSGDTMSFGKSTSSFSGHTIGKEFGAGIGKANQPQNQTSASGPTYKYSFDTSQIKDPLLNLLEQTGWKKAKSGFFGKLFG